MPHKLLKRQYQLQAQRRHEENLKHEYYRQTARYFERETILAKQFSSWCSRGSDSYSEKIEKAQRAEKLRVRREKLRHLLIEEEENQIRQLEDLKQKRPRSAEQLSLVELRRKLLEKRAEQSLYYPSQCRRLHSYHFSPADTARRLESLDIAKANDHIDSANKYSSRQKQERHYTSPSIERILYHSKCAEDLAREKSDSSVEPARSLSMSLLEETVDSARLAAAGNARRSHQSVLDTNIQDVKASGSPVEEEEGNRMRCSADEIGNHQWDEQKRNNQLKVSGWSRDDEKAYEEACSRVENGTCQADPEQEKSYCKSEPKCDDTGLRSDEVRDEPHYEFADESSSGGPEFRDEGNAFEATETLHEECAPSDLYVPHTDNDIGPNCHRRGQLQQREADCAGTGDISVQMYRYLKHNDLKRKIVDLCQRENTFVVKQCWDEALRLREMRNELILLKNKNLYQNQDLNIDEETRQAGIKLIKAREELSRNRAKVCNSSLYSDEAKELWKHWVREDDDMSEVETNEMRDLHLMELEAEWKNLALGDKNRMSQLYDRVISGSDSQDEHKLADILQRVNDRQKQYMNYIAT